MRRFTLLVFSLLIPLAAYAEKQPPRCGAIGTRSEGWYQEDTDGGTRLLRYASCARCGPTFCRAPGSRSEAWGANCDEEEVIIVYAQCSGESTSSAESAFNDVSQEHPNVTAIEYVHSRGIVRGYDDGTFRPDTSINRAEFVTILVGSLYPKDEIDDCQETTDFAFALSDVATDAWYANVVCVARTHGIIAGYSDGTFRPAQTINVAEAAKILALSSGLVKPDASGTPWYRPFIEALANRTALPLSIRSVQQQLTRGEMAEMIYRLRTEILLPSRTAKELLGN